ncbi:MAG: hypothetical protein MZV64_16595 [Ignavibacteriales bacterium]|nr:hypothetical protein [Ignavibacteriales bacterium]
MFRSRIHPDRPDRRSDPSQQDASCMCSTEGTSFPDWWREVPLRVEGETFLSVTDSLESRGMIRSRLLF